jgi:SAM-dependent methyltransferase
VSSGDPGQEPHGEAGSEAANESRRQGTRVSWIASDRFRIDDTTYLVTPPARVPSTDGRLHLVKAPSLVDRYVELIKELHPGNIVELGIFEGGSTAFFGQLARPRKLVAIDISNERVAALDRFLEVHALGEAVKPYFGVDQADRQRLTQIVEEEFGDTSLDLVVDDASHFLEPTRISFNVLFPRLRPGGVYVIEDWGWGHTGWDLKPGRTPLSVLLFELTMAMPFALTKGLVDSILIEPGWARVRRGERALDPETFDISACYDDRGRDLIAGLSASPQSAEG